MKTSLRLFISALALGLLASVPNLRAADEGAPPAQGQRGQRGGRGGMSIEQIETTVGKLTDDQKTKITALLEKANEARQAVRGSGGDQQANQAKMQELNTKLRADIRALLTEEQQKKFDAMPQGRGQGRGQGGQGGQGRRGQN
jgi:Spy/CpxP family protein refolding chaperone